MYFSSYIFINYKLIFKLFIYLIKFNLIRLLLNILLEYYKFLFLLINFIFLIFIIHFL